MAKMKKIAPFEFTPEAPTVVLTQVGETGVDVVCTGSAGAKEINLSIKKNTGTAYEITTMNGKYTISDLIATDTIEVKAKAISTYNTMSEITTETITLI